MDIAERLTAMLKNADLPAFEVEEVPVTYGPGADGFRRSSFALTRGGERYAEVLVEVHGDDATRLALVIWGLLRGSEGRLLDAEQTIENLKHALEQRRRELAELQHRLADFEKSRYVRGEFFAVADAAGRVWLCGRPSASAFGLQYQGWGELARERPGLRPCGTVQAEGDTYIIMRPVADLALVPQEEAGHG